MGRESPFERQRWHRFQQSEDHQGHNKMRKDKKTEGLTGNTFQLPQNKLEQNPVTVEIKIQYRPIAGGERGTEQRKARIIQSHRYGSGR